MSKQLLKELPRLVAADVISSATAEKIATYYLGSKSTSPSKLILVFSVLGALLVGLGIVLILAHNWDELSKPARLFCAFLPLLVAQGLCAHSYLRARTPAWREGSATFLFFSVGATISIVAQIYHISGDLSAFVLTWMLLCLPLVYLMRSTMNSLLYLVGITSHAVIKNYNFANTESQLYWLLLLGILPYYYLLYRNDRFGSAFKYYSWCLVISLTLALGILDSDVDQLMPGAYLTMFMVFYLFGSGSTVQDRGLMKNPYLVSGSLGIISMFLFFSFDFFWKDLSLKSFEFGQMLAARELWLCILLFGAAGALLWRNNRGRDWREINIMDGAFLFFWLAFVIGVSIPAISVILMNLFLLTSGVAIVRKGVRKNHFGILNYGLLVVTALVVCRFFDTGFGFLVRGLLFIGVGGGFIAANYWMVKKRPSAI